MTPDVGSVPKLSAKMYGAFLLFFCTCLWKYLFQFENFQEQGRVWDAIKVIGFRLLHWGNGHKRYAFPGFSFFSLQDMFVLSSEIRPRSFLLCPVIQRKDKRIPPSLYFVICPMGLFCHLSGDYFVCQILFFRKGSFCRRAKSR